MVVFKLVTRRVTAQLNYLYDNDASTAGKHLHTWLYQLAGQKTVRFHGFVTFKFFSSHKTCAVHKITFVALELHAAAVLRPAQRWSFHMYGSVLAHCCTQITSILTESHCCKPQAKHRLFAARCAKPSEHCRQCNAASTTAITDMAGATRATSARCG